MWQKSFSTAKTILPSKATGRLQRFLKTGRSALRPYRRLKELIWSTTTAISSDAVRFPTPTLWHPIWIIGSVLLLLACQSNPPPNNSGFHAVTSVPTLDETNPAALCEAIAIYWERDWETAIRALEQLAALDAVCGADFDRNERLYSAQVGYGQWLEQQNRLDAAIQAYQRALDYNPSGVAANEALSRLEAALAAPLPVCNENTVNQAFSTLLHYAPTAENFVQIDGARLVVADEPYSVYGVDYYPRDYPYQRFLTEMQVERVDLELSLMREAGFNTLRIYLRHDDLFQCPGNGAIPIPGNFARLDAFIQLAAMRGYKLILVLNQDADLVDYPLYSAPEYVMQQIEFIANRYRDEPAILAYDLRDHGDADYVGNSAQFTREAVLAWLYQAATIVRQNAPNQLITAGWDDDSIATIPMVDLVSFQHFGNLDALRQEIAILTDATNKPILLTAVGYSTYDMDELTQRLALQRAFEAVERNGLTGWIVWTAFDYPLSVVCVEPNCPAENSPNVHYGLWNTSYFPKRSVEVVRIVTGVAADTDSE